MESIGVFDKFMPHYYQKNGPDFIIHWHRVLQHTVNQAVKTEKKKRCQQPVKISSHTAHAFNILDTKKRRFNATDCVTGMINYLERKLADSFDLDRAFSKKKSKVRSTKNCFSLLPKTIEFSNNEHPRGTPSKQFHHQSNLFIHSLLSVNRIESSHSIREQTCLHMLLWCCKRSSICYLIHPTPQK